MIDWVNPPGASNLEGLYDIRGSARVGNRFVIVGGITAIGADGEETLVPAIWWSDNPTAWQLADLPEGYTIGYFGCCMWDVTAGAGGFVAVGEGLPIWSLDGTTWSSGTGEALGSSDRLSVIGQSAGGLIAVGFNYETDAPVARQSTDGRVWTAANTVASLVGNGNVTFFGSGTNLTAFVAKSTSAAGQTAVYRVVGPTSWQAAGTINDYITRATWGPHGWLAAGNGGMWLSPDLTNWTHAPTRPNGGVEAVIDDVAGYIAVTTIYPPGCAIDESQIRGRTWTSLDGLNWQRTGDRWDGRWLSALFILDRTLVGAGSAHEGGLNFGFVRTASLPSVAALPGPLPTPQPTPTPFVGC